MRILYIDIDSQRADHLGCYGYARATSPNIDRIAAEGVRFTRCYASDVPCLPSRTALWTGRFGIHTGVVGQGGAAAEVFAEGAGRGFSSRLARTSLPERLFRAGYRTATLSSFAQRHSAFHFYAGFQEMSHTGKRGLESAGEVYALARDWLESRGRQDAWFLHVNFWDPHTPYRAPSDYGEPFADEPLPSWLDERVRASHFRAAGPHSAQEAVGFSTDYPWGQYPRQPRQIDSMAAVRAMIDGYDTGVRYMDDYVGRLLDDLARLGVLEETAIVVSADHGENLGELNIYGDHHTADEYTCRLPMIVRWPGLAHGQVNGALHYQFDVFASLLELAGAELPEDWDARSFAPALREGRQDGRPHLVLSQGAWTCQRAVRFGDHLCIRTYHDGYHLFPDVQLFDLAADPHEQVDLAEQEPERAEHALSLLQCWQDEQMRDARTPDPLRLVLEEGGPFHVRGKLPEYLERLRATGRGDHADALAQRHPREAL